MKKIKLLFWGDSITDAQRDRSDIHSMGLGYPFYAAQLLQQNHPEIDFTFINTGISGDQTKDLLSRVQEDCVAHQPDVISILIGINDVWHHAADRSWIPNEVFEARYRGVLEAIRQQTHGKIMMMEPFLIPVEDKLFFREDLAPKIEIIRKLAREYADVYLPTDGLLCAAFIGNAPTDFAADGVHPTPFGAAFIGKLYAQYVEPLL